MKQTFRKTIRLRESELRHMISESVKAAINELDWKTYANAARKRLQQYRDDPTQKDKWERYYELSKAANQSFDDEYIGNMKYDTFGDKWKGKHSPKFDGRMNLSKTDRMPYGAINGYNKGGNKLFSVEKDKYYGPHGYTSPGTFFRDKEVADKFKKANDELWDYDNDNYEYVNGEGWKLKENINRRIDRIVSECIRRNIR